MDDQTTPVPEQTQEEPGIIEQIIQAIAPEQVEPAPDQVFPDFTNAGLVPQQTGALLPDPVSPYAESGAIIGNQLEDVTQQVEPAPDQVFPDFTNAGLVPQQTGALLPDPVSPYAESGAITGNQSGDVIQQTDYQNEQSRDNIHAEIEVHIPGITVSAGYEHEDTINTGRETTITSTNL